MTGTWDKHPFLSRSRRPSAFCLLHHPHITLQVPASWNLGRHHDTLALSCASLDAKIFLDVHAGLISDVPLTSEKRYSMVQPAVKAISLHIIMHRHTVRFAETSKLSQLAAQVKKPSEAAQGATLGDASCCINRMGNADEAAWVKRLVIRLV
ncbi:expressed unknown protein [Seminavis robusta]|uniref:Uncharacterized protein n=1 Tax=Seminavis robusta TaxID=568900 RepID=A0A9N8HWV8_9STRA|nr:expressed unknown protein [Seminavis robusta]|eukprot:Sro2055_g312821.1  (152) ;mRNA; f:12677-13132